MFVYCVYPAMTKHFKATAILSEKGINKRRSNNFELCPL